MPKNKEFITASVNQIREKLMKDHLINQMQLEKITIQEILAVSSRTDQNGKFVNGEFYLSGNDIIDVKTKTERKNESEDSLIKRVLSQITTLVNGAKKIHLQNNFTAPHSFIPNTESLKFAEKHTRHERVLNQTLLALTKLTGKKVEELDEIEVDNLVSSLSTDNDYPHSEDPLDVLNMLDKLKQDGIIAAMKPDCRNNITCISTNEFFFYPNKERGPLSQEGFNKIVLELEKLASTLPPNLHLLLSSFAVVNANKTVNNIALYITCGDNPSIHISAKMINSWSDPIYSAYDNPYFMIGNNQYRYINGLEITLTKLQEAVRDKELNTSNLTTFIENFIIYLRSPIFENPPQSPPDVSDKFKLLEAKKNKLLPLLTQTLNEIVKNEINLLATPKLIITEMMSYLGCYNALDNLILDHNAEQISIGIPILTSYLSPTTTKIHSINYNGHIRCQTENGEYFSRGIEICIDHLYEANLNIVQQLHNQMPTQAASMYMSQIISSNYIDLNKKSLTCETPTHVDNRSWVFSANPHTLTQLGAQFGDKIIIKVLSPIKLPKLTPELLAIINERNHFAFHIQACILFLNQHPDQSTNVQQLLNGLILNHLLKILENMAKPDYLVGCQEYIKFLTTQFIEQMRTYRASSECNSSKFITMLKEQIEKLDVFGHERPRLLINELKKHCKLLEDLQLQQKIKNQEEQFFKKLQSIKLSSLWLPKPCTKLLLMDRPASSFMRSHK